MFFFGRPDRRKTNETNERLQVVKRKIVIGTIETRKEGRKVERAEAGKRDNRLRVLPVSEICWDLRRNRIKKNQENYCHKKSPKNHRIRCPAPVATCSSTFLLECFPFV